MKNFIFLMTVFCIISCKSTADEPMEAQIVGEGSISLDAPEFATSVSSDQKQMYFNRTSPDRSQMQLMYTEFKDGKWTEAEALPFSTEEHRDVDPFLTHDGKRLYFSSTRPLKEGEEKKDFDTWYVEKVNGKWSEPINPGVPMNSDSTEIFVSMAKNRNAYFVSERSGERTIMVSRFKDGDYQQAEKITLRLRGKPIYASNPGIASDESFMIVAVRDPEGNGSPDLFISFNRNGKWSELKNLGPNVNSPFADFAPGLSKDDKTLYFTSERPGVVPPQKEGVRPPGDIYKVNLKTLLDKIK
ncbi:hypothetical protein GWK08_05435 [Leptobacterium flavescens]|uniref:Exo-alpha-sialidase n=1 Tax=Leptobacterium flavescens TaxID=472055 RepID=A0A6P0UJZ5_9FLAO|nr:PD40 domain-containing protein [Leptobacterium flavescens]NER12872.1 hypothetical protein [Leptobacterium flavescens]